MSDRARSRFKSAPHPALRDARAERTLREAIAATTRGDSAAAIEAYERLALLRPRMAEVHCDLGNAYRSAWRLPDALAAYRTAVALAPDFALARTNLGITLGNAGLFAEAAVELERALQSRPGHVRTRQMLMLAYVRTGRDAEAAALGAEFARAAEERPDDSTAQLELAIACGKVGDMAGAERALLRAERLAPNDAEIPSLLGLAYQETARYAEAEACYDRVLAIDPADPDAHYYRSMERLRRGDWRAGWAEYEWRWRATAFSSPALHFAQPAWRGESVDGRTVLLVAEQGLGDGIQFARFARRVQALGARVIVQCERPLAALLVGAPGIDQVVVRGEALPEFDLHAPMMSLPRLLDVAPESVGEGMPWLDTRVHRIAMPAPRAGARLRVGLVWAGSPGHVKDAQRSATLAAFDALLQRDDVEVVSLQRGPATTELDAHPRRDLVLDVGRRADSLRDTADAILQLDLVVAVDTAVAHLAASLGVPTWTLLALDADWRWGAAGEATAWYPAMTLWRQTDAEAGWAPVIARVLAAIDGVAPRAHASESARALFADAVRLHLAGDAGAEAAYRAAIAADATIPEANNNLGVLLRATGRAADAAAAFDRALALRPAYGEALVNRGLCDAGAGLHASAAALFRRATVARPDDADAWINLGLSLRSSGDADAALAAIETAARLRPDHADVENNLGNALAEVGRSDDAVAAYRRAIALSPDHADAWNNLGAALRTRAEHEASVEALERALALRPGFVAATHNLCYALHDAGRVADGNRVLEDAVAARPECAPLLASLATSHYQARRLDEAEALANRALAIDHTTVDAHVVLGMVAGERVQLSDALAHYGRALEVAPDDAGARWNRALARLTAGDYVGGFADYECRWRLSYFGPDRRTFAEPRWTGESLDGRTILLYTEQGVGDAIQFVRFVGLIKARWSARVIVECAPVAASLLRECSAADAVVARGEPRGAFDVQAPLMSVPFILGLSLGDVPAPERYLAVPSGRRAKLRARDGALRVGIVWAGRADHKRDAERSLALEALAPLAAVPGVQLYSLQKGAAAAQLARVPFGAAVEDLGGTCSDFVDTAAAIAALDLVVTVDTSVAHLAAALGRPTWVLVSQVPDWRWMLDREDSPWYPSVRLFRQARQLEWAPVVARVAEALGAIVRNGRERAAPLAPLAAEAGPRASDSVDSATLPSVERYESGAPRFALRVPMTRLADDAGFARFERELAGGGVDAAARAFLCEEMFAGDVLVDAGAGWGFSTLAAATRPGAGIHAVAVVTDAADAAMIERAAADATLTGTVDVVLVDDLAAAPVGAAFDAVLGALPPDRAAASWLFVRAARALDVPALLASAGAALEAGRVAAVVWPHDAAATPAQMIALGTLDALGFSHFALAHDERGALLVPLAAAPDADVVVSLAGPRLALQDDEGAAGDEPNVSAALCPSATPEPRSLGIDWQLSAGSGWGVYGMNLALHALRRGDVRPVLFREPDLGAATPMQRHLLAPALDVRASVRRAQAGGATLDAGFTMLRALGNGLLAGPMEPAVRAAREVGVVFFEDTALDRAAVERGNRFDRIVAGSTWNAEVLRAAGVRDVRVAIQGVDPTIFHPAERSGLFGDRFVVFSGGKLEYRKGQDVVVAAFRAFRERHPDALLLAAWHNHWPQTMAELSLGGHVRGAPDVRADGSLAIGAWLEGQGIPAGACVDLGAVPNAMMGQVVREAHVAVFPNRCEGGTNLVAMECMASGVPTVVSANTGHLDLVAAGGCAVLERQALVRPTAHFAGTDGWGETSVEEVVEALEWSYANREAAASLGMAGAEAMRRFTWARQIDCLLEAVGEFG